MASQNTNQQDETAIDKMNSQLTAAGDKIANNKKIIYITTGAIILVAVVILGYLFGYRKPIEEKAFEAYNKVEQQAFANDSIAAAQYKQVADNFSGSDAPILPLSVRARLFTTRVSMRRLPNILGNSRRMMRCLMQMQWC